MIPGIDMVKKAKQAKTRQQIGKASKMKGKVGEREVAALLRSHGFSARRTSQFCGQTGEASDVVSDMEGFHIEVKRTEQFAPYTALDQAERDAGGKATPVVFHRKDRRKWIVVMDADEFLKLMREYVYE